MEPMIRRKAGFGYRGLPARAGWPKAQCTARLVRCGLGSLSMEQLSLAVR